MTTRWLMSALILTLVIITGPLSCNDATISETNSHLFPREASLEEAGEVLGIEIPRPAYLPEGYSIKRFLLERDNRVSFTITNENGCDIGLNITWQKEGLFPARFDAPKVYINDIAGYFLEEEDSNSIWWNWQPELTETGIFVLQLKSCKELPTAEMIFIAESVEQ